MNSDLAYKKSSFGPAFLFLSPRKRAALAHYYAFCRLADDIVDEPSQTSPQKALDELAEEVKYIYLGAPQTQLGQELVADVRDFNLPKDRFDLLLEGMRADLQKKTYVPTGDEELFAPLDWYIYRVAVIVGKATLDILGVKGPKADELAYSLGTAVQLTNIVRDVYEDARLGRVYLPCHLAAQQIMLACQSPEQTEKPEIYAYKKTLEEARSLCMMRARENYTKAFDLMEEFWPIPMLPCRVMGYVYQKNLAKIEKSGLTTQPVKLTKNEKLKMVSYALFKTFF